MSDKAESTQKGSSSADGFLHRVTAPATWADVPLPKPQSEMLRKLVDDVPSAAATAKPQAASATTAGGRGVVAILVTPDTALALTAARAVASKRGAELYRVDIAAVVGKFIGETEKNLDAVFADAERSGAILLFDEAEALFGRRTDVRDANDRYANLDVGAALQRLSRFEGVAIVVTQRREHLDQACLRSARYIVELPSTPKRPRRGRGA